MGNINIAFISYCLSAFIQLKKIYSDCKINYILT